MLQSWRWFGPDDPVSLENVRQAGAVGVVSALHHMNRGEVWSEDELLKRRAEIEAGGLVWSVSESIGVGKEIKTRSGAYRAKIDNYKQSIRNAARVGVKTFCYNLMAITDWTRTNLNWPLPNGGTALRFDAIDYAAYDIFILKRDDAEGDCAPERVAAARVRFQAMTPREMQELEHGHLLGDDSKQRVNPGYSSIGRLKGLAELRGVMQTVEAFRSGRAVDGEETPRDRRRRLERKVKRCWKPLELAALSSGFFRRKMRPLAASMRSK
jgi:D-mannonate dehydratase